MSNQKKGGEMRDTSRHEYDEAKAADLLAADVNARARPIGGTCSYCDEPAVVKMIGPGPTRALCVGHARGSEARSEAAAVEIEKLKKEAQDVFDRWHEAAEQSKAFEREVARLNRHIDVLDVRLDEWQRRATEAERRVGVAKRALGDSGRLTL